MPSGVYERTPEHCAAMSAAKKGVPYTPEHCAIMSKAHKGVSLSPEHCAAISKSLTGVSRKPFTPEHKAALSEANKESDAHKTASEKKRGGHDIVYHHYLYDHADLSKYTVGITRSNHTKLHNLFRRLGYKVPHINVEESA